MKAMINERNLAIAGCVLLANLLALSGTLDKLTIAIFLIFLALWIWQRPTSQSSFEVFPAILPEFGDNKSEWVYVIQDIQVTGFCKIGRTVKPKDRFGLFDVKLPFKWQFVVLLPCKNSYQLERELHSRFAKQRINGEWFNLSALDVTIMKDFAQRLKEKSNA